MLGPTIFLIFINDIDKAVNIRGSSMLKFADDTAFEAVFYSVEQKERLHEAIGGLEALADIWQMVFNASKCHILHIGRK